MSIVLHEDRCAVSALPPAVCQALEAEKVLLPEQGRLDFCGMVMQADRTDIFLPRNSGNVPDSAAKSEGAALMRAIHKYAQKRDRTTFSDGAAERILGNSFLSLAFTLLTDFSEHGLYVRRTSQQKINSGKTDWKKTLGRLPGYPAANSMIYPDTVGRKTTPHHDDDISRIHAAVIRQVNQRAGWIVFDRSSTIEAELVSVNPPAGDLHTWKALVKRELVTRYADREIRLMKSLLAWLEQETGASNCSLVVGINKFHGMWEHMIDTCMLNKFDINHKLAKPSYLINGAYQVAVQKGGRTDTVLSDADNRVFAIIDAKYYGADNLANLPGWPDIVKQFFYAHALKDIYPDAAINNTFIFPGSGGPVESVHLQAPETGIRLDQDYPPIQCRYLSPLVLIEHYNTGKKLRTLSGELLG